MYITYVKRKHYEFFRYRKICKDENRNNLKHKDSVSTISGENYDSMYKINDKMYFHNNDEEVIIEDEMLDDQSKRSVDDKLGKFFLGCGISFRTVESPFFQDFVKSLQNLKKEYKPPCRKTLAGPILQRIYREVDEERKLDLKGTDGILMLDGWKNKVTNRKHTVCTVKNIHTSQTFLYAEDTTLEYETSSNLALIINKAVKIAKEDYDCYIYATITDNASNVKGAVEIAKTYDNKDLWQATCSSHSADLMFNKFKKDDNEFFTQIKSIISEFRDPKLQATLIELGGTKIIYYPDTRWCYLRDSLLAILHNLPFLRLMCDDIFLTIKNEIKLLVMDEDFAIQMKNYVLLFEPICKFINRCQDPEYTLAECTQYWMQLNLKEQDEESIAMLENRRKKAMWPVGFAANMLHPEFRGLALDDDQLKEGREFINQKLNEVGLQEYECYNRDFGFYRTLLQNCKQNPVRYWSILKLRFKTLATFAIKLMLMPASTAPIESLFSNWTFIHSPHRNKILFLKSCNMVDIYHSLKKKEKPAKKHKRRELPLDVLPGDFSRINSFEDPNNMMSDD